MVAKSYRELIAERDRVAKLAEEARVAESADAIVRVRSIMNEYGLTIADITGTKATKVSKPSSQVAKYMHPATGQTWSGRGRPPAWLGSKREKYRVAD